MGSDQRAVQLVGSIPGDDTERVVRDTAARPGPRLRMLLDGEAGERRNWILPIIESFRTHPDLELVRQGCAPSSTS